jgi:hypothetical protein
MTRPERLAEVAGMVESGSLVIRTATEAERRRYGIFSVFTEGKTEKKPLGEPGPVLEQPLGGMDELAAIRSASQRAAAIVQREVAAESSATPIRNSVPLSAAELAREAGVSLRTVERAQRVQASDQALFERLLSGEISATAAAQEVSSR